MQDLETLRKNIYTTIHSFLDALEAADAISDARFKKAAREKAEVDEIISRIFPG